MERYRPIPEDTTKFIVEDTSENNEVIFEDLSPEERLVQLVEKNPEKYSEENVERVTRTLELVNDPDWKGLKWTNLEVLDEWSLFKQIHSWDYLCPDPKKIEDPLQRKFVKGFLVWSHCQSQDQQERRILKEAVLDYRSNPWKTFRTIEDWVEFKNQNGLESLNPNPGHEDNDRPQKVRFVQGFGRWVNQQSADNVVRRDLREIIFKYENDSWNARSRHDAVEGWQEEFRKHPDWRKGLSRNEVLSSPNKDLRSLAISFNVWVMSVTDNKNEQKALRRLIFDYSRSSHSIKTRSGEVIQFDSRPERLVGMLLLKYGLIEKLEEEVNLHVGTNSNSRHSIDFLVNDTFIEYHPLSMSDHKQGLDLEQAGERKARYITKEEYKGYWFYHIWEIDQLYDVIDILKKDMPEEEWSEELRALSKEQFDEMRKEAEAAALDYDRNN